MIVFTILLIFLLFLLFSFFIPLNYLSSLQLQTFSHALYIPYHSLFIIYSLLLYQKFFITDFYVPCYPVSSYYLAQPLMLMISSSIDFLWIFLYPPNTFFLLRLSISFFIVITCPRCSSRHTSLVSTIIFYNFMHVPYHLSFYEYLLFT